MTHKNILSAMKADAERCNARMRQNWPKYERNAVPARDTAKNLVYSALEDGPSTAPQLRDMTHVGDRGIHGAIRALIREGKVEVSGVIKSERGASVRVLRRVGS